MHGRLEDFLPGERRGVEFTVGFELPVGLRDLVQSIGVPHVEVASVAVDGVPATWSSVVDDGSLVDVRPRYPLSRPPPGIRFLLDAHLGKLAGYLRLVGLDAEHDPTVDDPELVERANGEDRTLLTRDRGLLMRGSLGSGSYVRATDPVLQAIEVVERFALGCLADPFSRCMVCNTTLTDATRSEVAGTVPDAMLEQHARFRRCPGCDRVYWEGSHHRRLVRLVERITGAAGGEPGAG
jgi:uncharacterized protein with PIN domain